MDGPGQRAVRPTSTGASGPPKDSPVYQVKVISGVSGHATRASATVEDEGPDERGGGLYPSESGVLDAVRVDRYAAQATGRRQPIVLVAVGVLVFLGLSAIVGGAGLTFGGWIVDDFPADWLDRLPLIDSWLLPGLVLGIGFGLGSLVTAYGVLAQPRWPWLRSLLRWTGHHWSWAATIALGLGQVAWIALELIYLPGWSWLHVVYGVTGFVLVLLPLLPVVSSHLRE